MARCVPIELDQLVMGRPLPCAIHDTTGRLLLAEGRELTADLKQKLRQRGISQAVVNDAHVAKVTVGIFDEQRFTEYEEKLNDLVAEAFRTGMFQVRNSGPPVSQRVVEHGCTQYDAAHQQEVKSRQSQNAHTVQCILDDIAQQNGATTSQTPQIADACIDLLTRDFGGTLNQSLARHSASLAEHAVQIAMLGMALGIALDLDQDNLRLIGISALLADIGMVHIPKEITEARRRLSNGEFAKLQRHTIFTANEMERMPEVPNLAKIVAYQVHERPDGSGYPRRRTRDTIHQFALLLHVADAYVAMTSERPYRPAMIPYAAMSGLLSEAKRNRVDSSCVRALLRVLSLFPIGSLVALSDGSVAQVMRANGEDYMNPIVARVQDEHGENTDLDDPSILVDLSKSDLSVIQALAIPGSNQATHYEQKLESASCYCLDHQV
jgi:HD-GYP domain-containing protein (c-di-GMP phosphodiesterase class II)